jgi:hypothetical protein
MSICQISNSKNVALVTNAVKNNDKILETMDNKGEFKKALKAIRKVADNLSWFRYYPHHWAQGS